jgi:hypothetical protein
LLADHLRSIITDCKESSLRDGQRRPGNHKHEASLYYVTRGMDKTQEPSEEAHVMTTSTNVDAVHMKLMI